MNEVIEFECECWVETCPEAKVAHKFATRTAMRRWQKKHTAEHHPDGVVAVFVGNDMKWYDNNGRLRPGL